MPPLSTLLQLLEPYSIVPGRQQKGLTRGPTPVLLSPTAYILGALGQNALGISCFSVFFFLWFKGSYTRSLLYMCSLALTIKTQRKLRNAT